MVIYHYVLLTQRYSFKEQMALFGLLSKRASGLAWQQYCLSDGGFSPYGGREGVARPLKTHRSTSPQPGRGSHARDLVDPICSLQLELEAKKEMLMEENTSPRKQTSVLVAPLHGVDDEAGQRGLLEQLDVLVHVVHVVKLSRHVCLF